jgi:hypothetical protein
MATKEGVSPSTVIDLEQLLKSLEAEREAIRKRLDEHLADYERRIAALQMTLGMVTEATDAEHPEASAATPRRNGLVKYFEGLSQFEAMIKVAESSPKKTVRPTDVAPMLQKAGLAKGNVRNLVPHLYRMLRESQRFEKVAPGTFRLVPSSSVAVSRTAISAAANPAAQTGGERVKPTRAVNEKATSLWERMTAAARAQALEAKDQER